MRALLVSAALLAFSASDALALCVHRPDDRDSHYVENGAEQALCLQRELANSTANAARDTQLDIQIEALRQRALEQQAVPAFTLPPLPTPQF